MFASNTITNQENPAKLTKKTMLHVRSLEYHLWTKIAYNPPNNKCTHDFPNYQTLIYKKNTYVLYEKPLNNVHTSRQYSTANKIQRYMIWTTGN